MKTTTIFLLLFIFTPLATAGTISKKSKLEKNLSLKGHYIWGHEVNTFTPCGDKKTYWVEGSSASIEKLKTKHQSLTQKPYEQIFTTVTGRINTSKNDPDSFAEEYDGVIFIDSVGVISKSTQMDCKSP